MKKKDILEVAALAETFVKTAMPVLDAAKSIVNKEGGITEEKVKVAKCIMASLDKVTEDGVPALSNETARNNILTKLASHEGTLEVLETVGNMLVHSQAQSDALAAKTAQLSSGQLGTVVKESSSSYIDPVDYFHDALMKNR